MNKQSLKRAEYSRKYRETHKEQDRKYREDNKEKLAVYHKQYREANREALRLKNIQWRDSNRERLKEMRREKYWANIEEIRKRKRQEYLENEKYYIRKAKEYRKTPQGRESAKRSFLKYTYNLTLERWNEMFQSQNGKCALCLVKRLRCVDHCHLTGRVRALLCGTCNTGLGAFNENTDFLKRAIAYLEEFPVQSAPAE